MLSIYYKAKVRASKEVLNRISTLIDDDYLEHLGRKDSRPKSEFNMKRESYYHLVLSTLCQAVEEVAACMPKLRLPVL
jgi:hypothetical protein